MNTKNVHRTSSNARDTAKHDAHSDALTGEHGTHPIGTGVGAATGGVAAAVAAGAAVGTVAGPVGTAVGAAAGVVVGAVAGGLVGKAVAESVNPTIEHGYWRKHYKSRPYTKVDVSYDIYGPAYEYGWESQNRHSGKTFDEVEPTLKEEWDKTKAAAALGWSDAKEAVRDSWNRITTHQAKKHEPRRP